MLYFLTQQRWFLFNISSMRVNLLLHNELAPPCVRDGPAGLSAGKSRPEAISCNMRYESWAGVFGFPPSHRVYLNKFQQQKLIQGQSGFISLCLRLHVSTGTSNLPTVALGLSTALFIRFTFLYSSSRKLFKDKYEGNSRCFRDFTAAAAQTVGILCVHLFDNVILFIFSPTTTNTTWQ